MTVLKSHATALLLDKAKLSVRHDPIGGIFPSPVLGKNFGFAISSIMKIEVKFSIKMSTPMTTWTPRTTGLLAYMGDFPGKNGVGARRNKPLLEIATTSKNNKYHGFYAIQIINRYISKIT